MWSGDYDSDQKAGWHFLFDCSNKVQRPSNLDSTNVGRIDQTTTFLRVDTVLAAVAATTTAAEEEEAAGHVRRYCIYF